MASIAAAQGLSSFIQAFNAVDAVGSRRRREKLLAERLEDEREFRAQNLAFAQSQEDRAQSNFDETQEARERRREADGIGLDPASTDTELIEASKDSVIAQNALEFRNQTGRISKVLRGVSNQALATKQATDAEPGASEDAPLIGLSAGVDVAELPGDVGTRRFSSKEIAKQRGVTGFGLAAEAGFSTDVPGDYLDLDEIKELGKTDPDRAQAIRQRQTAELIEAASDGGRPAVDINDTNKADAEQLWSDHADSSNPAGDQWRQFVKNNPSAAVAVYAGVRRSLKPDTRRENDVLMHDVTNKALAEQRLILDAEDADPTSQDIARARRKYSLALGVGLDIVTSYDPAKEVGIRDSGVPQNASGEELANAFGVQVKAAPRTDGAMIPDNKQRQVTSQLKRDHANPTKRATPQQLKNIALGVQMNIIPIKDAVWAAWHGGQLPGPLPEHIVLPKGAQLIAKNAGGFHLIASNVITEREANEFSPGVRTALQNHFSQWTTDSDKHGGQRLMSAYTAFLGRNKALVNAQGIDLTSEIDVVQLARKFGQEVLFQNEYHENFWEGTPDFVGDREDYAEHFDSLDAAVFGTSTQEFLAIKHGEIFDEFSEINIDPLTGAGQINAERYRKAVALDSPQAGIELDRRFPSNQALEQAMLKARQAQQGQ